MAQSALEQRNQEATCFVGNLDDRVTEEVLWELFLQTGPVASVYLPKDRISQERWNYGFVEMQSERDADYAIKILNMVKLYGKPLRVNKANSDRSKMPDIGANLFIGHLDPSVDEKLLLDTFSTFGPVINARVVRDLDSQSDSQHTYGFVHFDSFEAADLAIECMNNQYLCNRQINVQYAYKKDSRERHGSEAERKLAAKMTKLPAKRIADDTPAGVAPGAALPTAPGAAGAATGARGPPAFPAHVAPLVGSQPPRPPMPPGMPMGMPQGHMPVHMPMPMPMPMHMHMHVPAPYPAASSWGQPLPPRPPSMMPPGYVPQPLHGGMMPPPRGGAPPPMMPPPPPPRPPPPPPR